MPRASFVRAAQLALSTLALLAPAAASAGPWTKDAGGVYAKLSGGAFIAGEYVDPSGAAVTGVDYLGVTTALYVEAGVAEGLQVQLYLPHVVARNSYAATGDRYLSLGFGDARVGVQYGFPFFDFPLALRIEGKVPLYDVAEPGGLEHGLFPALGDGQVDLDYWLSAGGSLDGLPLYGFVELGYRLRTSIYTGEGAPLDYGDALLTYAQLGYTVYAGVIVAANAQAVVPFEDDGRTKGYATVGPSIYAPVGAGLALELYYDATIWARAASAGQTVILGVSYAR